MPAHRGRPISASDIVTGANNAEPFPSNEEIVAATDEFPA
jgi:hypothetical protein